MCFHNLINIQFYLTHMHISHRYIARLLLLMPSSFALVYKKEVFSRRMKLIVNILKWKTTYERDDLLLELFFPVLRLHSVSGFIFGAFLVIL